MTSVTLFAVYIILGCLGAALLVTLIAMPLIMFAIVGGFVSGAVGKERGE